MRWRGSERAREAAGPLRSGSELPVYSVRDFTRELRRLLEANFGWVRVRGQVSNLSRPQSGHLYFSLVDDEGGSISRVSSAQVPVVVWRSTAGRLRFRPENGMKLVVTGHVTVYEPRGTYQVIAERLEPLGVGELHLAFEQLKRRLQEEGLFDPARKRRLPFLPARIGVITSPSGAAVRDFLRVVLQRFEEAWVRIIPVRVQGDGAAEEIAAALDWLGSAEPPVDVVVLARGGGSLEDLWAFNEECVARALARCPVPTVSAVGHEVDFTIADFVADCRAPTPTAAAERVVPLASDLHLRLSALERRLVLGLRGAAERGTARLEAVTRSRYFLSPGVLVEERAARLDEVAGRLEEAVAARIESSQDRLGLVAARLEDLNPLAVLARGYSVTLDTSGRTVRSARDVHPGDRIRVRLARGSLDASVERAVEEGGGDGRRER